jgi:hypothetical protein
MTDDEIQYSCRVLASDYYASLLKGFSNPIITPSLGGHATCIQGDIPVTASALIPNSITLDPRTKRPSHRLSLIFFAVNSTLPMEVTMQPKSNVSGTYNINAKLCFPTGGSPNASLVQPLTHGVGFDKSYWELFSADLSYADNAALAGYTTLFSDRLGVGLSDHPDPIQVIQPPLHTP